MRSVARQGPLGWICGRLVSEHPGSVSPRTFVGSKKRHGQLDVGPVVMDEAESILEHLEQRLPNAPYAIPLSYQLDPLVGARRHEGNSLLHEFDPLRPEPLDLLDGVGDVFGSVESAKEILGAMRALQELDACQARGFVAVGWVELDEKPAHHVQALKALVEETVRLFGEGRPERVRVPAEQRIDEGLVAALWLRHGSLTATGRTRESEAPYEEKHAGMETRCVAEARAQGLR